MIGIEDFITEMSALNNRSNASLRNKRDSVEDEYRQRKRELDAEFGSKFNQIDYEMGKNSKEDMLRIMAAAGIKPSAKSKDVYEFAVQMCNLILGADKPYGAFYALLVLLKERAEQYGNSAMTEELDRLLDSDEVEKLIYKDKEYLALDKKRETKLKSSDTHNKEKTDLVLKILKLEDRYPELSWYRQKHYYDKDIRK